MDEVDDHEAHAAVNDPTTPGATLRSIAETRPDLWVQVAQHPNAYSGLLDWLDNFGDDQVRAAVASRRTQDTVSPVAPVLVPTLLPQPGFTAAPIDTTTEPRKRSTGIVALIVILAAMLVGIAGVLIYFVAFDKNPASSTPPIAPATTATTSSPTPVSTPTPAQTTAAVPSKMPTLTSTQDVPAQPPVFLQAAASSVLPNEGNNSYGPVNLIDGNLSTAWVEGADGPGVGEWAMLVADTPQVVNGVTIYNGYDKNEQVFDTNHAAQNIRIGFSDGTYVDETLSNTYRAADKITFTTPKSTLYLKFTILSVYPNNNDSHFDTCISEITPF